MKKMQIVDSINWDIQEEGIQTLNSEIHLEGWKSIRRNDDGGLLSIKPETYNPMTMVKFLDRVEGIRQICGFDLHGYQEVYGGKIILAYLKNNNVTSNIGGHKIEDYMVLGNSYNGKTPFMVGTSTVLLRCMNQWGSIHKLASVRHTKNFDKRMIELYKYIDTYNIRKEEMYTAFNKFGEKIVSEKMREDMVRFVLGMKKTDKLDKVNGKVRNQYTELQRNITRETKDLGMNLWGMFNGVTRYTTHEKTGKHETLGALFGSKSLINQKAYQFALKSV